MNKLLKYILISVVAVLLLSATCMAAPMDDYSINDETSEITLKGSIEGAKENDSITIQILKIGKTSEDVLDFYETGDALIADFVFFTQVPADENGAYEESFSMSGEEAGFYKVRVNGADAGEIYFSAKESREAIVTLIKENCVGADKTDAIDYLKANFELHTEDGENNTASIWLSSFSITDSLIYEVSENGLFKIFLLGLDDLSSENLKEKLTEAAYIAAVNEGKTDLAENADVFLLDEDYVEVYNEKITNEAFMEEYFTGKGYTTLEEISNAFNEAVLLDMANSFDGWKSVESYIKDFGEKAGVDMKTFNSSKFKGSLKSKLYDYILDCNDFDSMDDFADEVNDEIEELLKGKSSSSSGGGGGGGGYVKTDNTVVSNPVVPVEKLPEEPVKEEKPEEIFTDLSDVAWAKESIEALSQKGVVSGIGDRKFEPARNVNREEIVVMLLKAYGINQSEDKAVFTDAAQGSWYEGYLAAAKVNGFVSGKPDGSFGVGENVTRQDVAVMAYNIAKAMGKSFDFSKIAVFGDDNEISAYASEAVYALKNAGIINGKGDGNFAPKATCTRAEAAVIINSLITK